MFDATHELVYVGGIPIGDEIILVPGSVGFVEKAFHHEFSHILYAKYHALFNERKWRDLNPDDFAYGKSGIDYIKQRWAKAMTAAGTSPSAGAYQADFRDSQWVRLSDSCPVRFGANILRESQTDTQSVSVSDYAKSALEEDVCEIAAQLFSTDSDIWHRYKENPIVRGKYELLISFYNSISGDTVFSVEYFDQMYRKNVQN